jgi:diphosphomevalonate decarboxylase
MSATHEVTVLAPINIAFIKYWGKREGGESLILPTNDSFSITLSTGMFRSKTSVILSEAATEDTLWLNGEKVNVAESKRLQNVLATVRATCPADLAAMKVTIVSNNNFPTAAGMASSASGYCALACALVKVFESTADASMLARVGSGSACRSVYGGFVKWLQGTRPDGTDCIAQQFRPAAHWPEMNVLCAVVKGEVKDVSSTSGMQLSLKTSPLMAERIAKHVPERMEAVSKAIEARDFDAFASITMVDSDDLQAVCATTVPKIQYATQQSYSIIKLVHALNAAAGKKIVAYTFDAGANAFLFTLDENLVLVAAVLLNYFPAQDSALAFERKGLIEAVKAQMADLPENMRSLLPADAERGPLTYLLQSPVGSGPSYLAGDEESLIDAATLQPKKEWKP